MRLTELKLAYGRELKETVGVRRYTGSGANRPRFDVFARGKATLYQANEMIGTVLQGDKRVIVLVEDVVKAQMALPITTNDKVVVRNRELAIISSAERCAQDGTIVAYELQCRG